MHKRVNLWLALSVLLLTSACASNGLRTPSGLVEVLPTRMLLPTLMPTAPSPTRPPPSPIFTPTETLSPPTETPTATMPPTVNVVIAMRPIPAGAVIPADVLAVVAWPQVVAPTDAFRRISRVEGQVALTDITCYEPLLTHAVAAQTIPGDGTPFLAEPCPPLPDPLVLDSRQQIVIVTRFVDAGIEIQPHAVALRPWPAQLVPPGAITSLAEVFGRVTQQPVFREQPLLVSRISASDQPSG